jgi:predicted nucleic acid-binding protein
MIKTYVLDASAIVDFVESGRGAATVERIFNEALRQESMVLVSVVNWAEVLCVLWNRRGEDKARQTIASLTPLPFRVTAVDLPQALKAAEIKVLHKISMVDSLAAALTELHGAALVTGDRDFERLGRRVQILWLRRP